MRRSGLYVLFFLSGASALVYELVWQRLLNLVFGVTTLSVSAVLAAFMGGLALGSLLLGRYADRTARPLRWYAWLEAGIGLTGLLVPAGFAGLTLGYAGVYAHFPPGPWAGACIRFGLSVLVLVVPATLMGATLPVMGRLALRRAGSLPATFSLLYAVNTMGAVVGTALTGFVLLRVLGMRHTLWLAAGLNLAVAVSAGLADFWRRLPAACPTDEPPVANRELTTARPWLVLACAGVTGAAGMAFEVAWARILAVLTSNSAYAFALLLTVLLLGLGLGSLAQWAWSRRAGDSWRRLAQCQWLLAASTVAALPLLRTTPVWLEQWCGSGSVTKVFAGELALTAALLLLPAVLMGMSLPLLVAGLTQDAGRFGRWVGRLYAVNTLGGVAGAVAAGLLLIPWLGIQFTLGATASLVLFVGLLAWARAARPAPAWRCLAGAAVLAAASGAWLLLPAGRYLKSSPAGPRRLVFYQEGTCATVSVVEEPDGTRSLLVDGQPVAGTVSTSVIDQKMLAHIPLLLHPNPRRALTVGFGSGGTSHSMTLHGIDVDCVEIEAGVPAAAECFDSQNEGVLAHQRFRLIVDDARSWLRVAPVRYDVIVTDCTNIQYRANGDLYTTDYFRLLRDRLAAGGLAAAWVPANGIQDADLRTLLRSFREVFPHTTVWYMNALATDFLIVVGTPGPLAVDLERLRQRMQAPGVAGDLAVVGLADPCRLLYTFLAGESGLTAYLGAGPLNTDDRPVLSYTTYGATFSVTAPGNLIRLLACRTDVAPFVAHPAPREVMLRHYAASNDLLLGHIAHLVGAERAALAYYLSGSRLLPGDPAVRELVRATYRGFAEQHTDPAPAVPAARAGTPPDLSFPAASASARR